MSIEISISYAREDKEFKKELKTHFAVQVKQGKVRFWDDEEILGGANWEEDILDHFKQAKFIIVLLSPNFFSSDFLWNKEMPIFRQHHQNRTAKIVPILVRPCDWEGTEYAAIQAIPTHPKTGKLTPVSLWENRDEAWLEVLKKVYRLIPNIENPPSANPIPVIKKTSDTNKSARVLNWFLGICIVIISSILFAKEVIFAPEPSSLEEKFYNILTADGGQWKRNGNMSENSYAFKSDNVLIKDECDKCSYGLKIINKKYIYLYCLCLCEPKDSSTFEIKSWNSSMFETVKGSKFTKINAI